LANSDAEFVSGQVDVHIFFLNKVLKIY
jgi:hypothetical protein